MSRQRLDVSHDRLDPREVAKASRRHTAAELQAARDRQQAIERAQAASVAAALKTPSPRVAADLAAGEPSRGEGPTSQQQAPPAAGVRGGGDLRAGSSAPASVPSRPALTIPPGAEQWRHVPKDGWVLSGAEKQKVERLLAEAARREAEQ